MEVETSLLLGVLFLLILLVLSFFGYLVYSGLLSEINIGTKNNPLNKLTVAYKFARGPYKNAGDLFTEVHALTPDLKCIGIYYDCPDEVIPQRLRYMVGAILSEGDNEVNEDQKNLLVNRGYKVTNFPLVSHAVVTSFPFVNTFSVFIAIIKVYPKINQYITERSLSAHPMMEIYEKGVIFFVAPLARQDEFYVPESLEEDDDGEDSVVSTAQSDGDESVITDTEPTHQEEVISRSEEKTESSATAANTSEEETSQREENPVAEGASVQHPEEEKSGEVEGRSSEQGDDDSSASSSFEELTLDAAESESNDKATS